MDSRARPRSEPIDLATHAGLTRPGLRLEPATRSLHGPAGTVVLEPRVMQVLLALADADGGVVSREALLLAGWGSSIVGDDAIHRAVAGARRVLRQAGAQACTVETIPRVGYRLVIADVALDVAVDAGAGVGNDANAGTDAGVDGLVSAAAESASSAKPVPPQSVTAAEASKGTGASTARDLSKPVPQRPDRPARRRLLGGATAAAVLGLGGWQLWRHNTSLAVVDAAMDQARQALRLASPDADQRAVSVLESTLSTHSGSAAAWGLLALARRAVALATAPAALPAALAAVEQAADRALAQDPRQPDALTARATLMPAFGNWARLDAALREVHDQHPDHLPSLDVRSFTWAATGLIAAHYPLRLKTVLDDPLHAGYNFRSIFSHWMNGQLAAADQAGDRGLELWPQHIPTWGARADLLAYTGRADRAMSLLGSAPASLPPTMLARSRLVWTALASRSVADLVAAREQTLAGLERGGPLLAVGATMDLAALGDVDLALDVADAFLLERGGMRVGTHWRPGQPWHLDVRRRFTNHLFLPVTAPLRQQPRFAALMQDIGLVEHWQRSGRAPDHLLRPGA